MIRPSRDAGGGRAHAASCRRASEGRRHGACRRPLPQPLRRRARFRRTPASPEATRRRERRMPCRPRVKSVDAVPKRRPRLTRRRSPQTEKRPCRRQPPPQPPPPPPQSAPRWPPKRLPPPLRKPPPPPLLPAPRARRRYGAAARRGTLQPKAADQLPARYARGSPPRACISAGRLFRGGEPVQAQPVALVGQQQYAADRPPRNEPSAVAPAMRNMISI